MGRCSQALTKFLAFLHGLLDGGLDAELARPDPWDVTAVRYGFHHDGVNVQAGCVVVLGHTDGVDCLP